MGKLAQENCIKVDLNGQVFWLRMETKIIKRVRDSSLWKLCNAERKGSICKFRLCPDIGSACYTRLLGERVISPYRANIKPPLEVVVVVFDSEI